MEHAPMNDRNDSKADDSPWSAQIDRETWLELTALCERVVDTLGLVGPVLELAQDKSEAEQLRHLRAIKKLSQQGHRALKLFAFHWAALHEQIQKERMKDNQEAFDDIILAAHEISEHEPLRRLNSEKR
jgi:hypothetical protein